MRAESTQSYKRRTGQLFMHDEMFLLAVVRTTENSMEVVRTAENSGNHSLWFRNAVS